MSITENLILAIGAALWIGSVAAAESSAASDEIAAPAAALLAPDQRTSDASGRSGITMPLDRVASGLRLPQATADTLHHEIRAGDTLIIALPDKLSGRIVGRYFLLEAPALSWLVDHSFMWRTAREDTGRHDVLIGTDSPPDTLVVSIVVY